MKFKTTAIIILTVILSSFTYKSEPGKYIAKNGKVNFFSHTDLEDISADNNKVSSILDSKTGKLAIELLIKSFHFKKALMEEHFNENYMESDKFPKSKFDGKIENINDVDFSKNGTYNINISGNLTIKDKTNKVSTKGTLKVDGQKLNGKAVFKILLSDYDIKIPAMVKEKISNEIEISVDIEYQAMK
ncbi:MAG: YceI family protein [Bacteroidetes bacterium]|nr:YceI family protein [Bacteroidota bacterium]